MNTFMRAKLLLLMSVLAVASMAFPASARAQAPGTYVVQIFRVTTHVEDACGGPEFYSLLYSGTTHYRTFTANGVAYSGGEWRFEQPYQWQKSGLINDGETSQVYIRLMEQDKSGCGGADDAIDIVPGSEQNLTMWVTRTPAYDWVYWDQQSQICQRQNNVSTCNFVTHGTGEDSAWVRLIVRFYR